MANREALRELQSRLAERLQAARTQVRAASWLAVECRGQGFLFPLHEAGELFPYVAPLQVPHTRAWFAGVANLRGGLHGVVDLAVFLDLPGRPLSEGQREQSHLVALNPALGLNSALLVDRLAGLRSAAQVVEVAVDNPVRPAFAGACYRDADGRVWQEILLSALAEDALFLGVAA